METKRCSKCGVVKPISEFARKKASKDGIDTQCKDCHNQYYYLKEKENKVVKDAPKVGDESIDKIKKLGLDKIPPYLLIKTLRMYGYRGELELVTIQRVKV